MSRKILVYEISGAIVGIVVGSLLHFVFDWSGKSLVVAPIGAVNESVWEHLKLGFWPLLLWAGIEYVAFGKLIQNFFAAKAAALFVYLVTIPTLFYTYRALFEENLFVDIFIFVIAVILGQLTGYTILILKKESGVLLNIFSFFSILILALAFIAFTFVPPHIFLLQDPITGGYEIS